MKAIIFTNGEYKNLEFYQNLLEKTNEPYIICADGGANYARKLGITPNVILGDMDSISNETMAFYKDITSIHYPTKKDETDTELAIEHAIQKGATEVTVLGALGSRLDHSLGNIYLLTRFLDAGVEGKIVNENNSIYLINKNKRFEFPVGIIISLLPIGGDVEGINITGFEYPIVNGRMTMKNPYGISNVTSLEKQRIVLEKGMLLVIVSKD